MIAILKVYLLLLTLERIHYGRSSDEFLQTKVSRSDEPIMVLVTLSGAMVAIDPQTATHRWTRQHDPVVRSNGNENLNFSSIFLPDPVTGRLYNMKTVDDDEFELSRTDYTIPDLVLKAPFMSKEQILYTGRKLDTWFMINSITGECQTVMDFDDHQIKSTNLSPLPSIHDVYIGKTQYDVCMTDMRPDNKSRDTWNVSMYQYNAFEMNKEIYDKYEFNHVVSSSSGKILTMQKTNGKLLWHKKDLNSPVVALFMMGRNGFLNIPFTTVDDSVFEKLLEPVNYDKFNDIKLLETVFIGENRSAGSNSFYALPTLSDNATFTIREKIINFLRDPSSIIGHYLLPSSDTSNPKLITDGTSETTSESPVARKSGNEVQLMVAIILIVFATSVTMIVSIFVIKRKVRSALSSGRRKTTSESDDKTIVDSRIDNDGQIVVSKIKFRRTDIIGRGSEGTSVFKGTFEGREVAVKRLLTSNFSVADREVKMLQHSDTNENIIRYFCTEFDREFCYIAVELCACSLYEYTTDERFVDLRDSIRPKEVLSQATKGLSHLHQLNIIHRDLKPQNILISHADSRSNVRVLISDFGLCKKIEKGKISMTNRAGVAGTEGWIAPELLRDEQLTKTADIFSLGCVFYFTLTNGQHPFGDALTRTANILANKSDLSHFSHNNYDDIFASELIADMIHENQQLRPISDAILRHPLFWSEGKLLDFLHSVSDKVERLNTTDDPLWSLERNARMVVRGDWKTVIDEEILYDLGRQRTYHGISVRDLLRAIRNKRNHFMELSDEVKSIFGSIPIDYITYWLSKFPLLASHAYHVMSTRSRDSTFSRFYVRYHTFTRPTYINDHTLDNHELVELQARCKAEAANARSYGQLQGSPNSRSFSNNWNRGRGRRGFYNFKNSNE